MRSKPETPHQRICDMSIDQRTTAIMEDLDCIDKRLDALIAERNKLIVENEELASALRQRTSERDALEASRKLTPDMRSIVGVLRQILFEMPDGWRCTERLRDLLRRLDQESQ